MSDLGKSFVEAVEFVSSFHRDVSRLIGCVEDVLRGACQ